MFRFSETLSPLQHLCPHNSYHIMDFKSGMTAAVRPIPPQLSVVFFFFFPCFHSCFVLLSEGEVCSSLISITVSSFPITPRPPQTACLLLKIKNEPAPVRTCPSSVAKEVLHPPLNPLHTHSKLKELHFKPAPYTRSQ